MDNALKLRVMFDMVDKITKPLKTMLAGNKALASSLKETRAQLTKLSNAQRNIAAFRELSGSVAKTTAEMKAAHVCVGELTRALHASGPPSKAMIADFERAKQAAVTLTAKHSQQVAKLGELRTKLSDAGVATSSLARHERELKASIDATKASIAQQHKQLEQLAEREKRIAAARTKMQAMQGVGANMAIGGFAARSTGTHILGGLGQTLGEAKKVQNEIARIQALGLGEHATQDAVKFARGMKVYGASTSDNMTMMRDSMSIFADSHHAKVATPILSKMKFANDVVYGGEHAEDNERMFMNMLKVIELRGGTKDQATFLDEANRVQKVISATGGRVGGDQWMEFIQRGGVAAKSLSKDAFFYQMEPLIQEMRGSAGKGLMSGYQNLIEGRTTVRAARKLMNLGLLDSKKVEYDKNGHVKAFADGALLNSEQFKSSPYEWMKETLLPALAKKGITDEKAIVSTIGSMFTNSTASNLFTTMFLQRNQIAKNERQNKVAADIDTLSGIAQEQTSGKELAAMAKLRDLKNEIGQRVTPLYNAGLDKTRSLAERLLTVVKAHPGAAKAVITVLAVFAALLAVCGTLTIALAAILGPLALLRFSMAVLGMKGGLLTRGLGLAVGAFRMFGSAAMFAGRALLMNPIGLAITALVAVIVLAAYAIYTHWDTIKSGASSLWEHMRSTFAGGVAWLKALPASMATIGTNIISGLVSGITSSMGSVKDAIMNVASSTVGWFKAKLGIHSPSRVFSALGHFVGEGAALGIDRAQERVARAAIGLAAVAASSFAAPAIAAVPQLTKSIEPTVALTRPRVPIDTRGPLAATATGSAASRATDAVTINIYPQSGMDAQAIARAVAAELDRRERAKQSRLGSSLRDRA
ncbi:hypothetical protein [Caballeronia sp. NCTM5]|uniref:hypothetical protein n=1 Tax=Caballeronia sp. NCTM5 TaxID=2921755 RepID=UPI002028D34D